MGGAERRLTCESGPFELTKLSAQVSVLMADKKNCPKPESHAIAASYQNKGTLKTLGNIIKHRGVGGLYTGFRLHLSRHPPSFCFSFLYSLTDPPPPPVQCVTPSGRQPTS